MLRCSICNRQREVKCTSLTQIALQPHPSSMLFYYMTHNGEAKTGTTSLTRSRLIHTVEALEDTICMLHADALPVILYTKLDHGYLWAGLTLEVLLLGADEDLCCTSTDGPAVLDCVFDQVFQHLQDCMLIRKDLQICRGGDLHLYTF